MNLDVLRFDTNSGLCAPSDQEFRDWLNVIEFVNGDTCSVASFSSQVTSQSYPIALPISPLILPEVKTGVPPIRYTLNLLDLPLGLKYDSFKRTISGTPTQVTPPVDFIYKATDVNSTQDSLQFTIEIYSTVATHQEALPEKFNVRSNYPNPFQHTTRLVVDLPWTAHIQVEVMDVTGRYVFLQSPVKVSAGWGREVSLSNLTLPHGVYLYRFMVDAPDGIFTRTGRFVRVQ